MQSVRQPPAAARTRHVERPPGPRGAQAAKVLAQFAAGRPLQACTRLAARYGDTVYLPVRPWEGLYIFSRPDQAEHVLAVSQDNYVKPCRRNRCRAARLVDLGADGNAARQAG